MSRLRTGKPTSSRRAFSRPRLPLWLVPAAVAPIVFFDALVGFRLLASEDGFIYYLPLHILAGDAIAAGTLPAWNPFAFSGFPLLALTQAGVFYPPNLLFVFLPHFVANNITLIASISIGATGTFFLARRLANDEYGAIVAGATFASCGFVYGHLAHQSILAAAAWLPWTLVAYERARGRCSPAALALVAAPLALCLLTGHAQMFSLSLIVLAAYATTIWVLTRATPEVRRSSTLLVLGFAAVAALQIVLPEFWPVIVAGLIAFVGVIVSLVVKIGLDVRRAGVASGFGELTPLWIVPLAVVAALALAAVQVLPNLAVLDETIRADLSYPLAMAYSFPASHLVLLPFPYLFGNPWQVEPFDTAYLGRWNLTELAGYPGAAALVLASAGTLRLRQNTAAVALVVAGAVALLMALGGSTAFGVLMWATPVIGDFRSWGRAVVVVDLVVAVLAAHAIAHLRSGDAPLARAALRRASIAVVALVAGAALLPVLPPVSRFVVDGWDRVLALAIPLIAAALGLLGAYLVFRRQLIGTAVVVALVVIDGLLGFGAYSDWRLAPTPDEARAEYSAVRPPSWGAMPGFSDGPARYLYAGKKIESIVPDFTHVTSVKGIRSANGYEPLAPATYAHALGDMTAFGGVLQRRRLLSRRWLFDLLQVTAVLAPRNERVPMPDWLGEPRLFGDVRRFDYTPRLPPVFAVTSTRRGDEDDALRALASSRFDAGRTAVVDATCRACPSERPTASRVNARATHWTAGRIDISVRAQAPSLVIVSESWFPGWTAKVDGEPAETVRTDGLVIGVPVPAGAQEVELRYRTPGLRLGAAVSIIALLALGAALLLGRRRRLTAPACARRR